MNGAGREESRGLGPELCFLGNGRQPGGWTVVGRLLEESKGP